MSEYVEIGPVNGLLIKEKDGEREFLGYDETDAIKIKETYKAPEGSEEGYVGIPKEIRDELESEISMNINDVVVRNEKNGMYSKQKPAKTAEKLTSDGEYSADNPENHAVMTDDLIKFLGLEKVDERDTEEFSEKYEGFDLYISY